VNVWDGIADGGMQAFHRNVCAQQSGAVRGCAVRVTSGEGMPIVVTADRNDASQEERSAGRLYPDASARSANIKILRGCHGLGM
jgi:hypothetical protein